MKKLLIIPIVSIALGCASIRQDLEHTETDPKTGIVTSDTTHTKATALWDSKTIIDKMKTSNGVTSKGKTQTTGVSGLSEESSSTNTTNFLIEGLKVLGKGAVAGGL